MSQASGDCYIAVSGLRGLQPSLRGLQPSLRGLQPGLRGLQPSRGLIEFMLISSWPSGTIDSCEGLYLLGDSITSVYDWEFRPFTVHNKCLIRPLVFAAFGLNPALSPKTNNWVTIIIGTLNLFLLRLFTMTVHKSKHNTIAYSAGPRVLEIIPSSYKSLRLKAIKSRQFNLKLFPGSSI